MKARFAVATLVLALTASGMCFAGQPQPRSKPGMGVGAAERLRDINLTEAQEATIAGIRDEYAPRVEEAVDQLRDVIKEEAQQARAVLTPEQLKKLETMKLDHQDLQVWGLAARIAHVSELGLTEDEMERIANIRNEYRPKVIKVLDGLRGILTPEQAKIREDALKAGKSRREVVASLKLTDDQKAKVESAGKEVRVLVREELTKMRDVLNPEQQDKLAAMKEDRQEHVRDRLAFGIEHYKELNLTDQQKQQIQAIRAEYRPRVENAGDDVRAIVREELAAIVAVLGPAPTLSPTTPPLTYEKSATGSVTARVMAVNVATRQITLQGPSGVSEKFIVDPQVKRLNEVSVGDNLTLSYTVSLLGELRAPTAEESAEPISYYNISSRTASPDEPAGAEATAVKVVTTVDAVDIPNMLVTLKGPLGNRLAFHAKSPENIRKLHVGDTIIVTYTEGVAMALDKTP
jgi:Spy/CpxP family protein refolding chaperone